MVEREVENILEQDLRNNGYYVDVGDAKRNVYRQNPRTEDEAKLLSGKHPDFILYADEHTKYPLVVLETKKSKYIKLEKALEQAIVYAKKLKARIAILCNGSKYLSYWVKTKEPLFINDIEVDGILPIDTYQKFTSNKLYTSGKLKVNTKQELINIFKEANTTLREAGITVGLGRFAEFSNLLFLKLMCEKNVYEGLDIPVHLLWDTYKDKDGLELLAYINDIVIPGLNGLFKSTQSIDLFTKLKLQDPIKLKHIVDKLDSINLSSINTDVKGDAFEYFIEKYNSNNNDLGEYFTPRHVVSFLVALMAPEYPEKVYDPFCGTGGMLISSFDYIKKAMKAKGILNDSTIETLRKTTLYGSEISDAARIAKMNMILTGDGHTNVIKQDSFMNPVDKKYDVVITNIPFNMSATKQQAELYEHKVEKGNALALQHVLLALNSNTKARAAVIVPEIVLNDSSMTELRKTMVKRGNLKGVISLPSKVFMPYTEAKTSILVLGGDNTQPCKKVFFYKVSNDGYTLTTRRRKKSGITDLDEFLNIYPHINSDADNCIISDNESLEFLSNDELLKNKDCSFLLFKYKDKLKNGYIRLGDILERVKIKNTKLYETASITKQDFWGMPCGSAYWGENFVSVTSASNAEYSVVEPGWISFNPARANIGSFGINAGDVPVSVTSAYPVFKVKNSKKDKYIAKYVYLCLKKDSDVIDDVVNRSYGTVRQSLSADDFLKVQIKNKSIQEQKDIVDSMDSLYAEQKALANKLADYQM